MASPNLGTEKDLGFYQLTGLTAAKKLSSVKDIPKGCAFIYIQPEGANVRWRSDGAAPSAAVGNLEVVNARTRYNITAMEELTFIEVAPTATVNIQFTGLV